MNRRLFRGNTINRDRREQAFARAVIAEVTKRYYECQDCGGSGRVTREDGEAWANDSICLECGGKGRVS